MKTENSPTDKKEKIHINSTYNADPYEQYLINLSKGIRELNHDFKNIK